MSFGRKIQFIKRQFYPSYFSNKSKRIFCKAIFGKIIPIKMLTRFSFFMELDKLMLNFIWKNKGIRIDRSPVFKSVHGDYLCQILNIL